MSIRRVFKVDEEAGFADYVLGFKPLKHLREEDDFNDYYSRNGENDHS